MDISTGLGEKMQGFSLPRSAELPELDFYMDQVVSLVEKKLYLLSTNEEDKFITPSMINNYVKLGIIPPPVKKRYTKEHLCYLFIICTLKSVIPIPAISRIIAEETKNRSIFELYDIFCEAYENMLAQSNCAAKDLTAEGAESAAAKLALFMAINASATQLVATHALTSLPPVEEAPEKEKEKKEKKEKEKKEKKEKAPKK